MEKKNIKVRIITIIMASVLAVSSAFLFVGCKNDNKSATTAPTTAAATAATTAKATEAKAQSSSSQNGAQDSEQDVSSQIQNGASSDHNINEVWFAGISEQAAGQQALQESDPSGTITYYVQGTYNGQDCWIVYVMGANQTQYDVYISGDFCHVESNTNGHSINDAYFAGISEQAAGQEALQALGSTGWKITSSIKSTYNGADAWQVTIENENGESQVVFVNGSGCYY